MTIPVNRNAGRASNVPERIRLAAIRTDRAGGGEASFARRRSEAAASQKGRRTPTIRAWRAPETEAARGFGRSDDAAAATIRAPLALANGNGSRQGAARRTARTRAVEQAFREELRRQAEAEAE